MSQLFMLDTDIASYVIKGGFPSVDSHLSSLDVGQACVSAITRAELRFGVRRLRRARLTELVEKFLEGIRTLPWDAAAADCFADVRIGLERIGIPIGTMDTMIAAHAKALNAVLITNNVRHFRRVSGLSVRDWIEEDSGR